MHFRRLIVLACAAAVPTLIVAATSLGQASAAPSNTSLPSISGSARDGSLLQASHGSWTGSPTSYAYQWERCDAQAGNCASIAAATSDHYTVQTADVAHRLRVQVTASNASGSGMAVSRPDGGREANRRSAEEHGAAHHLRDDPGGEHPHGQSWLVEWNAGAELLVPVGAMRRDRRRLRGHLRRHRHDLRARVR